mmetsp:Transcript_97797/g.183886  ORF Transcript_97797/g.183886 Transcript_97797/m.183886 type:complete len:201 (+) Transcript_97797:1608-2210(+)
MHVERYRVSRHCLEAILCLEEDIDGAYPLERIVSVVIKVTTLRHRETKLVLTRELDYQLAAHSLRCLVNLVRLQKWSQWLWDGTSLCWSQDARICVSDPQLSRISRLSEEWVVTCPEADHSGCNGAGRSTGQAHYRSFHIVRVDDVDVPCPSQIVAGSGTPADGQLRARLPRSQLQVLQLGGSPPSALLWRSNHDRRKWI